MSYYDHKWQPWRTRVNTTSIASMAVWERPRKWHVSQAIRAEAYASLRVVQACRVLLDADMWGIAARVRPSTCRDVWQLVDSTPALTWLVFTKHPHLIADGWPVDCIDDALDCDEGDDRRFFAAGSVPKKRENVWLGVDVSTQAEADEMIPALLKCRELCGKLVVRVTVTERIQIPLRFFGPQSEGEWLNVVECGHKPSRYGVDWIILQGDVGRNARPCNVAHVRELVGQAREAVVTCWVERLGSRPLGHDASFTDRSITVLGIGDRHGADPSEWPEDLRNAREVPT